MCEPNFDSIQTFWNHHEPLRWSLIIKCVHLMQRGTEACCNQPKFRIIEVGLGLLWARFELWVSLVQVLLKIWSTTWWHYQFNSQLSTKLYSTGWECLWFQWPGTYRVSNPHRIFKFYLGAMPPDVFILLELRLYARMNESNRTIEQPMACFLFSLGQGKDLGFCSGKCPRQGQWSSQQSHHLRSTPLCEPAQFWLIDCV